MSYFKSLLFNFLCVFFVNHVVPGVEIAYYTKIPNIKGEMIFAFSLGFLNSLIFPLMKLFRLKLSHFKIGMISFLLSFGAYSIINILPLGVKITTPGAFVWSGLIVWFGSYLTNHLEYRDYLKKLEDQDHIDHQS
ncbi:MAG TPA: phage holin family protein [Chlamydiales bacterium]|nr:phage holin family protein [Chlamydiales bacterium]